MSRIVGVTAGKAGPYVKLIYFFTRRSLAKLTASNPDGAL
jgi:hypothetical protein